MKKALVLALTALVLFVAGSAYLSLYPGVPRDLGGVESLDDRAEKVRIPVGEDDHVDGWRLRGSRPGVVVLFHGYARDHEREWRYAQFLRRDGWTILAIDFRSARVRDRKPTTLGFWERLDARATLDWIAAQPDLRGQRVLLFGESLGGATAIAVAAERPEIAGVVADSPFSSGRLAIEDGFTYVARLPRWPGAPIARALSLRVTGHDPEELDVAAALRALGSRPVLLIQSGIWDRFGPRQVQALEQAAGPGCQRWMVADVGHNQAWVKHREAYEKRVRAFVRGVLAPPATRQGGGA